MGAGFLGTFVISWSQTEVDGLRAAPISAIEQGAVWSWQGEVVRVDGPTELLRLARGESEVMLRRKAARMVRKLVGAALTQTTQIDQVETDEPMADSCIVVTDGQTSYTLTLIEVDGAAPLVMFLDAIPPKGADLWVVHHTLRARGDDPADPDGARVICFTPGTLINTAAGPKRIELLREGDYIQTKDNGLQEVQWIGSRKMTGARLFALPKLRPIRIKPGALGPNWPRRELIVSPEHRILVRGEVARTLFNTPEVLVTARQLENGHSISTDYRLREVTYMHLLMPRHEILFANGVETESFHPADAEMGALADEDRSRLLLINPEFAHRPFAYGDHARRQLTASEAAILRHEAA
ncbi:Hint domain-containing protein [Cognatishimia sp. SS12]|uniref:Hint domain-containing protein n=1 Tax=Cognatishimia sp. SS12 TaxID=2979465 RepID=UPI00232F9341|nr:Hint domain-containing protein [Cognatishimia sp. SS12]MDC0738871.1 Hint domain-containing protein [Cognatishimia sp. SS12]